MKLQKCGLFLLLCISFFCIGKPAYAQVIVAEENSFGVDDVHKLIVWHERKLDSLNAANGPKKEFYFGKKFKNENPDGKLSYAEPLSVSSKENVYTLYITKLPLVHLTVNDTIKDRPKILSYLTYYENDRNIRSVAGVRHRGNLSLSFPKKSFDLEFWTDSISKQSKDVKFPGLRSDDDWILDGLYNEPLLLRSTMANRLWLKIHSPHYMAAETLAKSGIESKFVELFKNGLYQGLYALTEQVDRSLLKLKEPLQEQVLGELFKASSYEGAPAFEKAPPYENLFPHWGGYEVKYPLIDTKAHWNDLSKLVNLVVRGTEDNFKSTIGQELNLGNAIDYYLLVNLLRATDNLGKNYYIARYEKDSPYFIIPWDLDGVLGTIQDGKRIATTNDILSNGLYDRLLKVNPDSYRTNLKNRWKELRAKEFSNEALFKKIDRIYNKFDLERVYEREEKIWPGQKTKAEHYEYMTTWLNDRILYLDAHFDSL